MKETLIEHLTELNEDLTGKISEEDRTRYLAKIGTIIMFAKNNDREDVLKALDYIDDELMKSDAVESCVKFAIAITHSLR